MHSYILFILLIYHVTITISHSSCVAHIHTQCIHVYANIRTYAMHAYTHPQTHTEAVSLLVDAEPDIVRETKSIIEASKTGQYISWESWYTARLSQYLLLI